MKKLIIEASAGMLKQNYCVRDENGRQLFSPFTFSLVSRDCEIYDLNMDFVGSIKALSAMSLNMEIKTFNGLSVGILKEGMFSKYFNIVPFNWQITLPSILKDSAIIDLNNNSQIANIHYHPGVMSRKYEIEVNQEDYTNIIALIGIALDCILVRSD